MEEKFSPHQSLQLIESMIQKTRSGLSENRFYFLLWGWVAFTSMIGQFILKVVFEYRHHYAVWIITIPTIILAIFRSRKDETKGPITYVGESMSNLWLGVGFSFFILCVIISFSRGGWYDAYPHIILFYGLGTFVSGRILRFTPLVIGGIFNWILAIIAIFVPYDYQILIAALAVLTSYIIPGHLLK